MIQVIPQTLNVLKINKDNDVHYIDAILYGNPNRFDIIKNNKKYFY